MHGVYRVSARNTAKAAENKIHDDEVARRHGFAGGLVPGVTTWAYLCRPAAELLGRAWVERGTLSGRLVRPVYEGELLEIGATQTGDTPLGLTELELTATDSSGVVCAVATAGLPAAAALDAHSLATHPVAPLPEERPAASEDSLAVGTVLGTFEQGFHAERAAEFLSSVDDDLALWKEVAHPGWLMLMANRVLTANVALGPWVHIASDAQHLGPVVDGDRVAVRGKVVALRSRKGNDIVDLDLLFVANGDRAVMRVQHSAIWRLGAKR